MCQSLTGRESFRGIEIGQANNQIFELRINALPQSDRLSRVLRVKAISKGPEDIAPRTIPKMLEERIQSVEVREVGDLTFQDMR